MNIGNVNQSAAVNLGNINAAHLLQLYFCQSSSFLQVGQYNIKYAPWHL